MGLGGYSCTPWLPALRCPLSLLLILRFWVPIFGPLLWRRPRLSRVAWAYIILDEGHRLKNAECKLNAEMRFYTAQHRLLLTGEAAGAPDWGSACVAGVRAPLPAARATQAAAAGRPRAALTAPPRPTLQAPRCRTGWTSSGRCSTS